MSLSNKVTETKKKACDASNYGKMFTSLTSNRKSRANIAARFELW